MDVKQHLLELMLAYPLAGPEVGECTEVTLAEAIDAMKELASRSGFCHPAAVPSNLAISRGLDV